MVVTSLKRSFLSNTSCFSNLYFFECLRKYKFKSYSNSLMMIIGGVVTLNSPSGVLFRWFSPFVNKSPVLNLFFTAFNLVGNLFVLPCLLHVIESN